jgi:hypothetical protein
MSVLEGIPVEAPCGDHRALLESMQLQSITIYSPEGYSYYD